MPRPRRRPRIHAAPDHGAASVAHASTQASPQRSICLLFGGARRPAPAVEDQLYARAFEDDRAAWTRRREAPQQERRMLKIVSVMTSESRGGGEYAAADMLQALSARGHTAVMLTNQPSVAEGKGGASGLEPSTWDRSSRGPLTGACSRPGPWWPVDSGASWIANGLTTCCSRTTRKSSCSRRGCRDDCDPCSRGRNGPRAAGVTFRPGTASLYCGGAASESRDGRVRRYARLAVRGWGAGRSACTSSRTRCPSTHFDSAPRVGAACAPSSGSRSTHQSSDAFHAFTARSATTAPSTRWCAWRVMTFTS